jgi:hypothetical protein
MKRLTGFLAVLLILSVPALAQRAEKRGGSRVGGGHIPAHGPAPAPRTRVGEGLRQGSPPRDFRDRPGHPNAPHVHADSALVFSDIPGADLSSLRSSG